MRTVNSLMLAVALTAVTILQAAQPAAAGTPPGCHVERTPNGWVVVCGNGGGGGGGGGTTGVHAAATRITGATTAAKRAMRRTRGA